MLGTQHTTEIYPASIGGVGVALETLKVVGLVIPNPILTSLDAHKSVE